ncbi:MAG: hypothetical protein EXS15_03130 [Phycisphaerales bacterium]|nr:hypothetical protein [Phycisphaerales bacterium]
MARRSLIVALALTNGALVAALIAIPMTPRADGQDGVGTRSRATYSMSGGNIPGVANSALYIVDETHEEMISVLWNDKTRSLTAIGYRNLAADGASSLRPRP